MRHAFLALIVATLFCLHQGCKNDERQRGAWLHRISQDGTSEFLYLSPTIALNTGPLTPYNLAVTKYQGEPDYVWQTGDLIVSKLVDSLQVIGFDVDSGIIAGSGVPPSLELGPLRPEQQWFILSNGNVQWLPRAEDFKQALKTFGAESLILKPPKTFIKNLLTTTATVQKTGAK